MGTFPYLLTDIHRSWGILKIRIVLKQIQEYAQMNDGPILAYNHTIKIMLKLRSSEKEKLKLKENGVSVNCEC